LRVLITGATGFLGQHLCAQLARSGHRVAAYHRPGSRTETIRQPEVELVAGELDDYERLSLACRNRDVVVHAAADIRGWLADPEPQTRTNVDGSRIVALACMRAGAGRLIHVSSVSAVGIPRDDSPADEDFEFNLRGRRFAYHISKKRAEEAVLDTVRKGLDAVIVNPASIFGPIVPGRGGAYRGSEIMRKGAGRRIVPVFAGGRCIVHVEDVVDGILAAIESGKTGERYILGGDNVSFREITERSLRARNERNALVTLPAWSSELLAPVAAGVSVFRHVLPRFAVHHADGRFQYYSSDKARTRLGYSPRPFEAILAECLALKRNAVCACEKVSV
jgi:nucleoside-diphosphate-sugar epimerase